MEYFSMQLSKEWNNKPMQNKCDKWTISPFYLFIHN